MILLSLALSCVGLHVGQGGLRDNESLPRPSISAWPSWMVPVNSKVTLQCSAPSREVMFVFRKGRRTVKSLPPSESPEGLVEFHFTNLPYSAAGEYTCEYHKGLNPNIMSSSSDILLLVVTGFLAKPSLQGHHRGNVTAGENVTLQCQKPKQVTEYHTFALLKKGTPTPIQFHSQGGKETDFSLRSLTVNDTGNYSCVYYQTQAPFHASIPSDHIEIWVTDSPDAKSRDFTVGNLIRLGLSAVIMVLIAAFLVEAWWSQKGSPCGSRFCSCLAWGP